MFVEMLSGGQNAFACFRRQPFVVDAVQPVGMDVPLEHLHVVHGMRQHHHAARRIHDVVVELLAEPLPELQRMLVDRRALVPQIVRADDRRVAPGIAAAEPALLEHRDIGDAVLLGEVVGGRQPVAAAADDDDVIGRLRLGRTPLLRPVLVAGQRVAGKGEEGKARHRRVNQTPSGLPSRVQDYHPPRTGSATDAKLR